MITTPPPDTKVPPHDRPGLYLCCMRTAEKYYDQNARYGIVIGLVITCDNAKCGQPIEYIGGGWKHADAKH